MMFAANLDFGWVLPVIFLIVYVVQTVLKAREAPEKEKAVRPANTPPGSELDRFLAEIDRLKRQHAPRPQAQSPPPPPPVRPPVEVSAPAKSPKIRSQQTSAASRPTATPSNAPDILAIESALVVGPSPIFTSVSTSLSQGRAGSSERQVTLPAIASLVHRLDNIRTAIILQEILSPPKCKRR